MPSDTCNSVQCVSCCRWEPQLDQHPSPACGRSDVCLFVWCSFFVCLVFLLCLFVVPFLVVWRFFFVCRSFFGCLAFLLWLFAVLSFFVCLPFLLCLSGVFLFVCLPFSLFCLALSCLFACLFPFLLCLCYFLVYRFYSLFLGVFLFAWLSSLFIWFAFVSLTFVVWILLRFHNYLNDFFPSCLAFACEWVAICFNFCVCKCISAGVHITQLRLHT